MGNDVKILSPTELPAELKRSFKRIYDLDCRIDALKAEHITPVGDERTSHWRDLKASTAIARKDLDLAYKIYKREQDARGMEDADEGQRILLDLRRIFDAMRVGETLDWISALEAAQPAKDKPKRRDSKPRADTAQMQVVKITVSDSQPKSERPAAPGADWQEPVAVESADYGSAGHAYNAGRAAVDGETCPYAPGTVQAGMWVKGRAAAEAETPPDDDGNDPEGDDPEGGEDYSEFLPQHTVLGKQRPPFPH